MRKLIVLIGIAGLLSAGSAATSAVPNLVGTWMVYSDCVRIGDDTANPGVFEEEDNEIVIQEQRGALFWGFVPGYIPGVTCAADMDPGCNTFFGVIDGRRVHITAWDSISTGRLGKGANRIRFVTQNQVWNPGTGPGACIGLALKR